MRKNSFYMVTNKCNANCPYCFVQHGNYVISDEEIQSINVSRTGGHIIYGGEPTLYPDRIYSLVQKIYPRKATLYTNGSDLDCLKELSSMVRIIVNLDAFFSLGGSIKDIRKYEWVYTLSPYNIKDLNSIYSLFLEYRKYPYIKPMIYPNVHDELWENTNGLEEAVMGMYNQYMRNIHLIKDMPYLLKDTLKRMMANVLGITIDKGCLENTFYPMDKRCSGCQEDVENKKCHDCSFAPVCWYNIACIHEKTPCDVVNIFVKCANEVMKEMKDNSYFQNALVSVYGDTFNV